jgi:predicted metal-dependent peptidase
MTKNLLQVIKEAEEKGPLSQADIERWRDSLQAKKTGMPKPISAIKAHLWNTSEYELYEFLDNSEFWEVQNKDASQWFGTAGVRMGPSRIEFYYDKEFLDRLAKKPGQLILLIAHEASHILRYHIDRTEAAGHKGELANTAQDMIINDDIMRTEKIGGWKPELITSSSITGEEVPKGKKDEVGIFQVPDKFRKDFEEEGRKAYFYENMYNWLLANEKERKKVEGEPSPGEEKDYFQEGSIVKVNETGEYKKITKVNKDGTYETEPVDINAEVEKVKKVSNALRILERVVNIKRWVMNNEYKTIIRSSRKWNSFRAKRNLQKRRTYSCNY